MPSVHITPPSVRQVYPDDLIMYRLPYTYCDTFSYYYYSRMGPIWPRETNLTTVFIRFVFHLLHCLWMGPFSLVIPNCSGLRTLFHLHKCPIKNVTPKGFLVCNVCLCYNGSVKFFFDCESSLNLAFFTCLDCSIVLMCLKTLIFVFSCQNACLCIHIRDVFPYYVRYV